MLWATLQAHRVSELLLDAKFERHPNVLVILHQFLMDNSVPQAKHDELAKTVKALDQESAKQSQQGGQRRNVINIQCFYEGQRQEMIGVRSEDEDLKPLLIGVG